MEIGKPIKLDEARDIEDLKEKLKTYEKIRGPIQQALTSKVSSVSGKEYPEKTIAATKRKCYKCGQENHLAKDCKSSNFKCFKCGKSGHKAAECKDQKQINVKSETNNSYMVKSFQDITEDLKSIANRNFKSIEINGVKFSVTIDTGSDISIIRYDVFERLGDVAMTFEETKFITAGDYILTTSGYFYKTVRLDDDEFNIKFCVARNFIYLAAIGNDILQQANIIMSSDGAKFIKKVNSETTDKEDMIDFNKFCATVVIDEMEREYDLSHLSQDRAAEVKTLVERYNPKQQEPSPVSMRIVLSDDCPILQRPRRLSYDD